MQVLTWIVCIVQYMYLCVSNTLLLVTIHLFGFCMYSVPTESLSCHVVTSALHLSGLCIMYYVQCMYTHVLYPHTLDVQCINFHAVMHYGATLIWIVLCICHGNLCIM